MSLYRKRGLRAKPTLAGCRYEGVALLPSLLRGLDGAMLGDVEVLRCAAAVFGWCWSF
ncbi:hypothetical protein [Granulicella paludicola]|uniref:hypothetical protein n=1 Tax=Granulicella paludicola TaxID=474951 RepID=UPI0021DFBDAA|nr:hypothetical protein [Granulicella paludicola]